MSWIDLVQTIGIVASILFGLVQARIHIRSLRAVAFSEAIRQFSQLYRLILDNPEVVSTFNQPYPAQRSFALNQTSALAGALLTFFEGMYFQRYKYGFIEEEIWNAWVGTLTESLKSPYMYGHWQANKHKYAESFNRFVDGLQLDQS